MTGLPGTRGPGFDATAQVMRRLGYERAVRGGARSRRAVLRNALCAVVALAVAGACIAWWGAWSGASRSGPAVGDAIRGSVANGAGRLEAILLGMPRPVESSPTMSAEADRAGDGTTAPANGPTRTY